jgi:hypothetical protein
VKAGLFEKKRGTQYATLNQQCRKFYISTILENLNNNPLEE